MQLSDAAFESRLCSTTVRLRGSLYFTSTEGTNQNKLKWFCLTPAPRMCMGTTLTHIQGVRIVTENWRKTDYMAASRQDYLTGTSDIISPKRTVHLGHSDLLEEGFLSPQLLPTETSSLRGHLEDSTQQKPGKDQAQLTGNLNRQKKFV